MMRLLTLFPLLVAAPAAALTCDVTRYGARPGDDRPDTAAIQKAIDACAGRGGTVVVPGGRFLIGGLTLGSDMVFSLAPGAVLAAIPDMAAYPMRADAKVKSGTVQADDAYDRYQAILYAGNVRNLVIEGPGTLDGQGPLFWNKDFYNLNIPRPTTPRPQQMIEIVDAHNVTVRGLRLVDAPAYSIRFYRSSEVRAIDVTIRNDPRSPNTDGIQIRDTSNAFIRGADIDTGDDAIVVKSYDRVVDNLVVTDSVLKSDDAAIKFGTAGFKGVENSLFANITIRASRFGIALFQMDGGLYANNRFRGISIENGGRGLRQMAIYVDIDRRRAGRPLGRIEGLRFEDIDIRSPGNILIAGQPESPIRDLVLSRVRFATAAKSERFAGRSKPRGNAFVPLTGSTADLASVPASVTIGHAVAVRLHDLSVRNGNTGELRHALALVGVADADVAGLSVHSEGPALPPLLLRDSPSTVQRNPGPMSATP